MGFEHEESSRDDLWANVNGKWVPISGPFDFDFDFDREDDLEDDSDIEYGTF